MGQPITDTTSGSSFDVSLSLRQLEKTLEKELHRELAREENGET